MLQYFTNNQRHFAWLCVYLMVMIFALATSLAYRYYSGIGNLLWVYRIINAAAIIHANANSMGSMNADARLIVKAGEYLGMAGICGFCFIKMSDFVYGVQEPLPYMASQDNTFQLMLQA